MSTANPSPLRYPGGKYKISKLVALLIRKLEAPCRTYVEPFAGGAGVALDLLFSGEVEQIVINDSDKAIYSIWRALTTENVQFIDKMMSTDVTIQEWHRQREIYFGSKKYSLDYAFSAFFLNRTNHSGILSAGPIGGQEQTDWKLDVRFGKEKLARQIGRIGERKRDIKVYNRDVMTFIRTHLQRMGLDAFVYFDPPYYRKGSKLYKNFFTPELHKALHDAISSEVRQEWIVSYDDVPEIRDIYGDYPSRAFSLDYSLANNGKGREIMYFKNRGLMPTAEELEAVGMSKAFEGGV